MRIRSFTLSFKIRTFICIIIPTLFCQVRLAAQGIEISQDIGLKYGKYIYFDSTGLVHTSLHTYFDYRFNHDKLKKDSVLREFRKDGIYSSPNKSWVSRKIFDEHLVQVDKEDYSFYLDYIPDLQIGKSGKKTTYLNTRGVELGGWIGNKFSFTSHLYENQGKFADYYSNYIYLNKVVPGQGSARAFGKGGFDYGYSGGTFTYTPVKYLNISLGYDKNFIGDGYRSLLLSDNSSNYPFLKATGNLGNVRYMVMFAQFIDVYQNIYHEELGIDAPYPKKYGIFHYLSWNATKRLSLGLFENVMWQPRGLEFSYLTPLAFLRPIEFANGSPDKVLLGLNGSYKIGRNYVAYGQFVLNEFRAEDFFSGKGSWVNKHGEQIGIKGFDLLRIKGLNAQVEMNTVRPFTYSSRVHFTNYGHYNQSLAHPFGANFRELVGIVNYSYHKFDLRMQVLRATYGLDIDGLNYGKDIYKSYLTRVGDEGIFTGGGLNTKLIYMESRLAYIINQKTNLRLELGYIIRNEHNDLTKDRQNIVSFGLRSSFRNLYSDF
jgi:hypothetical protein